MYSVKLRNAVDCHKYYPRLVLTITDRIPRCVQYEAMSECSGLCARTRLWAIRLNFSTENQRDFIQMNARLFCCTLIHVFFFTPCFHICVLFLSFEERTRQTYIKNSINYTTYRKGSVFWWSGGGVGRKPVCYKVTRIRQWKYFITLMLLLSR